MKKIYIFLGLVLLTTLFFGCLENKIILYHLSYGDSVQQVRSRIYLKTSINDEYVEWESSHPLVISTTGHVTRPNINEAAVEVKLTATYQSKTYTYNFIVPPLTGNEIYDLYPGLNDENHIIEMISYETLIHMLTSKDQALIYIGFESCPWCKEYLPIFHRLAKNTGHEAIYYYNFQSIRTIVDNDLNPLFQAIIDLIDEQYLVKNPNNDQIWWLYAPTFIGLNDGEIKGLFTGAIENHRASEAYLTHQQEEELKQIFRDMLDAVRPDIPCLC